MRNFTNFRSFGLSLVVSSVVFGAASVASAAGPLDRTLDRILPEMHQVRCAYSEWDPRYDGALTSSHTPGLHAEMMFRVTDNREVRLGAVAIKIQDRNILLTTVPTRAAREQGAERSTCSATIGRRTFLHPQQSAATALDDDNLKPGATSVPKISMSSFSVVSTPSAPDRRLFRISCSLER
ncbi:MAG: hypothetical protein RBT63_03250 [Bdellovibrionales bacterium]|jgi:hypothetical protein|nr:hypothetical protein [Bdellovibrionales bacterium]